MYGAPERSHHIFFLVRALILLKRENVLLIMCAHLIKPVHETLISHTQHTRIFDKTACSYICYFFSSLKNEVLVQFGG